MITQTGPLQLCHALQQEPAIAQLADMCDGCKDPFMRFELDHNLLVVLKTKEAHGATQDILKTHCIPSAKSQDLK